jgi:TIR domain-containing protein
VVLPYLQHMKVDWAHVMEITLTPHPKLAIEFRELSDALNRRCQFLRFRPAENYTAIEQSIDMSVFSAPYDLDQSNSLPGAIQVLFTFDRLPSNYFVLEDSTRFVVSFADWEELTTKPIIAGIGFFLAQLLSNYLTAFHHHMNIGCLRDYLQNKQNVEQAIVMASFCAICRDFITSRALSSDWMRLRSDIDALLSFTKEAANAPGGMATLARQDEIQFDVFLCYNSNDRARVRQVAADLRARGVRSWMDEEQLRPGLPWQRVLESMISRIHSAAVFVGANGTGPWQVIEIDSYLREFVRRSCPVIPVILEDAPTVPDIPIFLSGMTWVDFRANKVTAIDRLLWGIRGTVSRPSVLG